MYLDQEVEKKLKMATGQEIQAAAAEKVEMGNPPPYSPPSQQSLQQEPTPQKEHVQQFVQHNPQGFVLQQQPYQPQTAGFSDISGGNGYNQTMPQQMSRAPGQMTSTQSTVIVNQPQQAPVMVVIEAPDDYLLPAILSCIFCFCCFPLGIGAIVAASNSRSQAANMKYVEAGKSATVAKTLIILAILWGILNIIVIIAKLIIMADQQNNY